MFKWSVLRFDRDRGFGAMIIFCALRMRGREKKEREVVKEYCSPSPGIQMGPNEGVGTVSHRPN